MGNYTGLRGNIKLKDEYIHHVKEMIENVDFNWSYFLPDRCNKFTYDSRSSFIPFGIICYIPWEETTVRVEKDTLYFACSLKNYNDTIYNFINYVLPEIGIEWELEELYEYDDKPTIHVKKLNKP